MSLNLLAVRAGVADSCAEIAYPCVREPLWGRSCGRTGRRRLQTFISLQELAIQADRVYNMDEVRMLFDAPYSRTVDTTGAESVPVSTTSHEKTGFTVVLACYETGKKLKPMVIFKRKTL